MNRLTVPAPFAGQASTLSRPPALNTGGPSLLNVQDVSVIRGRQSILSGVTLEVPQGQSVGILGANGAGKTTLLRCCAGLESVSSGTVRLGGHTGSNGDTLTRTRVGMVFQQHQLVRAYSALTNVIHGRLGLAEGWRCCWHVTAPAHLRAKAMACLEQVGMAGKAMRPVADLSGGEAQRVAIARALMRDPELLLADEPTASLDPTARLDVIRLLTSLTRQSPACLLVSIHDEHLALATMDRIVGLKGGRVVLDALAAEVTLEEIQSLYAAVPQDEPC